METVASYPMAALSRGYHDSALTQVDSAFGLNRVACWYRVVAASPTLQALGTADYESIYPTPALLFGQYARLGQAGQA